MGGLGCVGVWGKYERVYLYQISRHPSKQAKSQREGLCRVRSPSANRDVALVALPDYVLTQIMVYP